MLPETVEERQPARLGPPGRFSRGEAACLSAPACRTAFVYTGLDRSPYEPRCVVKEAEDAEGNLEVWFDPESEDTSYIVSASTWPC